MSGVAGGARRRKTKRATTLVTAGGKAGFAGFWFPAPLRARCAGEDAAWQEVILSRGRLCDPDCPAGAAGTVTARWPALSRAEWAEVVSELRSARERAPRGPDYWTRLQAALNTAAVRFADPADPYHKAAMEALPAGTGYSTGMIAAALGDPSLWNLDRLVHAVRYHPNKVCSVRWRPIPGLPGRVRFFPSRTIDRVAGWLPVAYEMPLYRADIRPDLVLVYGAGEMPGATLLMTLLSLSTTLRGEPPLPRQTPPPVTLVRSSIREPILLPLVLSAIEETDPDLLAMVAVSVWDQGDAPLQRQLLGEADCVLAAGDEMALALAGHARRMHDRPRVLVHPKKAGFTVITRDVLEVDSVIDEEGWIATGGTEVIDIVALLAGLDSALWDQNGFPAPRVHFVEKNGIADPVPAEYARRLTKRLRQIAGVIPRGAWPLRDLRDPFDRYKAIEGTDRWGNGLKVMSDYGDPFVVVFDDRAGRESRLDPNVFAAMVDECRSRVILVRTVDDIMEVPWRYLRMLPRQSLQSVSVATGRPGQGPTKHFLDFATACGLRGVTAISMVGKGMYPQSAYSWDGLLPLDLIGRRPPGYFTTIDFDSPFEDMMATYRSHLTRLATLQPVDKGGSEAPFQERAGGNPTAAPATPERGRSAPHPRSPTP